MIIEQILESIKNSDKILMSAHVSPDGDAIGALAGMAKICEYFSKSYTILLEEVPSKYAYLIEQLPVQKEFKEAYDTFIALDCGDIQRLGPFKEYFIKANKKINIDHHYTNNHYGTLNYVEAEGSSTSELVFNIIEAANIPLTQAIAEAIYTGIVFDTGGFMHSCTKPSTHQVAAKLLQVPFNFSKLYHYIIHLRTPNTIRMQSVVSSHIEWLAKDQIISYITEEDLTENNCSKEDVDGIVNYIKNIEGVNLAILLYPSSDISYKVSFRSNEPYDVAALATHFNGGGHQRAAGATIEGQLDQIITSIKSYL